MDFITAKKELAEDRLDLNWDKLDQNDRWSKDDIANHINRATKSVWDMHDWDFTEGQHTGTISSAEVSKGYLQYPDFMITGSGKMLFIDDTELKKVRYHDFVRAEKTDGDDYDIWADSQQNIYVFDNHFKSGNKVELYGKNGYQKMTSDNELLPFSHTSKLDSSGNSMIVDLAYANALASDKLRRYEAANNEQKKAVQGIEGLWDSYADDRASEKTAAQRLEVPDYFDQNAGRRESKTGHFNLPEDF